MGLSLQFLFKNYEPLLIVNGQEIVLAGQNEALMERTLIKYFTMEDDKTEIYKGNSVQGGTFNPLKVVKKKGKENNQEIKERLVETNAQQKI